MGYFVAFILRLQSQLQCIILVVMTSRHDDTIIKYIKKFNKQVLIARRTEVETVEATIKGGKNARGRQEASNNNFHARQHEDRSPTCHEP
jgi:hypothetical protein